MGSRGGTRLTRIYCKFCMKLKLYIVSHFVVYMAFSHGVYTVVCACVPVLGSSGKCEKSTKFVVNMR